MTTDTSDKKPVRRTRQTEPASETASAVVEKKPRTSKPRATVRTAHADAEAAQLATGQTVDLPVFEVESDPEQVRHLLSGALGNPFPLLGPHRDAAGRLVIRTFQPGAVRVEVLDPDGQPIAVLPQVEQNGQPCGLFAGAVTLPGDNGHTGTGGAAYRLRVQWRAEGDSVEEIVDPYAFGPVLGDLDLYLIAQGNHHDLSHALGSNPDCISGVEGTRFAVWAPNARRVSVIGDFNNWDGRRHAMRLRHEAGVWELFIPGVAVGSRYKYELLSAEGHLLPQKADPVARMTELPPATASIVAPRMPFVWRDDEWMATRGARHDAQAPLSVYEVHAASWQRHPDGSSLDWEGLSERLIPYVREMGFTHIELMPIMEHPFGGSWGYQPLSQFAPTARFGTPAQFAAFVDRCHLAGVGVILDWVPAHFPTDAHGLAWFDGSALYEHQDPREGFHQDWNTAIYNLGRTEVAGMLISSALEWLRTYHIDGLRVDAVASMLYRDYSRKAGEWIPNIHGGRENLESIAFLRKLNKTVSEVCPDAMMIAEESTSWPGVTAPVWANGLGFNYKWNMGWMHDTLRYQSADPLYRPYQHDDMTFGLLYAFTERFMLPISHDEVVHGKGSLLSRFPGEVPQKLANLRAYMAFMFSHPGKKLLFMGCELGQHHEWNHDSQLDWPLLEHPLHKGLHYLVRDLNHLYRDTPALHRLDTDPAGFSWMIGDDRANSVFAWLRRSDDVDNSPVLVVANMTPVARHEYRVGVPSIGSTGWREIFNSDAEIYGGTNLGNAGRVQVDAMPSHGQPCSVVLTLPPLSVIMFTADQ